MLHASSPFAESTPSLESRVVFPACGLGLSTLSAQPRVGTPVKNSSQNIYVLRELIKHGFRDQICRLSKIGCTARVPVLIFHSRFSVAPVLQLLYYIFYRVSRIGIISSLVSQTSRYISKIHSLFPGFKNACIIPGQSM